MNMEAQVFITEFKKKITAILDEMAGECKGDSPLLRSKLYAEFEKNQTEILKVVSACAAESFKNLIQSMPAAEDSKKEAAEETQLIIALIDAAEKYEEALFAVYRKLKPGGWLLRKSVIHQKKTQSELLDFWNSAVSNILRLRPFYQQWLSLLQPKNTRGRPRKLKNLEQLIYQQAMLYQLVTGNRFTVDDIRVGTVSTPITEGQRFVGKSLGLIAAFGFGVSAHYTPSNLQTACRYAARHLKNNNL